MVTLSIKLPFTSRLAVRVLASWAARPPALRLGTSVWVNSTRMVCGPPTKLVFEEMLVVCAANEGAAMTGMPVARPVTMVKLGVEKLPLNTPVVEVTVGPACGRRSSKTRKLSVGAAMATFVTAAKAKPAMAATSVLFMS